MKLTLAVVALVAATGVAHADPGSGSGSGSAADVPKLPDPKAPKPKIRNWPSGATAELAEQTNGQNDGLYERWAQNCQILVRGHFKAGKRDGAWIDWTPKGQKRDEGTYSANLRNGQWTLYGRNGEKQMQGPFVDNVADGKFTEWFAAGAKWREFEMKAGERNTPEAIACRAKSGDWVVDYEQAEEGCTIGGSRQGQWTRYYLGGTVRTLTPYVDNQIEGTLRDLHPTGELLHQGTYHHGVPDGVHTWQNPTGQPYGTSTITNGTGDWTTYFPDGKVAASGRFAQGRMKGVWTTYFDNGAKEEEATYDGMPNGPYRKWYKTGELGVTGQMREGARDGMWVAYWANGNVEWSGQYDQDARTGIWVMFAYTGTLQSIGQMEADTSTGAWMFFHDNGKPQDVGIMVADKRIASWQEFWADGTPWRTAVYENGIEAGTASQQCATIGGTWVGDSTKRMLGCQVCRAKPDDSIEQIQTGTWTWWHANGQIEKQGALDDGKQVGHWSFFYDNGKPMLSGDYAMGAERGPWIGAYRNGQRRFEGSYADGKPVGEWTSWQDTGAVLSHGSYSTDGVKIGTWSYYDTNPAGEQVTYEAGKPR